MIFLFIKSPFARQIFISLGENRWLRYAAQHQEVLRAMKGVNREENSSEAGRM